MNSEEAVERDNPYARLVTINGELRYEVGWRSDEEEGYNVRYLDIDPSEVDVEELRRQVVDIVQEMKDNHSDALQDRTDREAPDELNLDEEFGEM